MKKLIILGLAVFAMATSQAQLAVNAPLYLHDYLTTNTLGAAQTYLTRDSVTSGTNYKGTITTSGPFNYYQYDSIKLTGNYKTMSLLTVITKVSGTVAGTVRFEGSVDGLTWASVGADTLTLANVATNTISWTYPGRPRASNTAAQTVFSDGLSKYDPQLYFPYLYVRVFVAGTGTWAGTRVDKVVVRQ